jgi:CRP-like cAMP-binding protein
MIRRGANRLRYYRSCMDSLVLVVARSRPEVYASLIRQCAGMLGVRVVLDRREPEPAGRVPIDRRHRAIAADLDAVGLAVVPGGRLLAPGTGGAAPATVAVLRTLEVFGTFSADEVATLAARMRRRVLAPGEVLFREGDVGNEMYFVLSGGLVISKAVAPTLDKVLARMGPAEFFGEMNLFGNLQRSATVQAETAAEVLALDRDTLSHAMAQNPDAALGFFTAVVREFSHRLGATDDLVSEVTRWGLEATGYLLANEPQASLKPGEHTTF